MDLLEHDRKLRRLALRMLHNSDDAEDVLQDVYVKALSSNFEGRSTTYTWLYALTRNACIDRIRASSRRPMPPEESPPRPDELLEQRGQAVSLDRAVRRLPPLFREVVRARLDDKSCEQIAHELGVSCATVRSRMHRARTALSKELLFKG